MITRLKLLIPLLLFPVFKNISQAQVIQTPSYHIEAGSAVSAGQETPFWLMSNQYGLITPNKINSWLKAGFKTSLSSSKPLDFDYGLELIKRHSNKNQLYLNQGYARVKIWFINVQGGRMEEKFGNQDSSLTSGGLLWSGNAQPLPKITIYVPNYIPIPYTKGYLEFKGGISHGWFGDQPFVKNYWLHHKYVYVQFGGHLPIHFHFGMHHFAQWGGESLDSTIGKLPSEFKDFEKIFLAKSGKGSTSSPWAEWFNRLGNHIGSKNFGLDLDIKNYKSGIYWQTIFEDGSGRAYRNISDGLWGFYLHSKNMKNPINGFVYEFIKTTNQSGAYNQNPNDPNDKHEYGGNDNYFNHSIYLAGWTYNDMTIGTPLITSPAILHEENQSDYVRNNKIIAHHLALSGTYKNLLYKIFYTYSLNYGTNDWPFANVKVQHSLMVQSMLTNLPWGTNLEITFGADKGKMYGNSAGVMLKLSKIGSF